MEIQNHKNASLTNTRVGLHGAQTSKFTDLGPGLNQDYYNSVATTIIITGPVAFNELN